MHAGFSVLLLLFLLGVGVPVAWSFAGTLLMLTLVYDVNLNTLMLQGFRSLNSLVLLALPLFIMAGYLMQAGGIAHRLVGFAEMLVKNRRGAQWNNTRDTAIAILNISPTSQTPSSPRNLNGDLLVGVGATAADLGAHQPTPQPVNFGGSPWPTWSSSPCSGAASPRRCRRCSSATAASRTPPRPSS